MSSLLSPQILFFILGGLATLIKSDVRLPSGIGRWLGLYLMIAIGFKGGVAIQVSEESAFQIDGLIGGGLVLSCLFPVIGYKLLRWTTKHDPLTSIAAAAQYGSVSIVTYVAGCNYLSTLGYECPGYMSLLLGLMEAPAILVALYMADQYLKNPAHNKGEMLKHVLANEAVFLLLGSMVIGFITGAEGFESLRGFLVNPFQGALCLFLLDMGALVMSKRTELRTLTFNTVAFGIYMPLLCAAMGLLVCILAKADVPTTMLFTTLAGSVSNIAVPVAMRMALPDAKAGVYIPLSLGISFPFNLVVGIPLYMKLAEMLR